MGLFKVRSNILHNLEAELKRLNAEIERLDISRLQLMSRRAKIRKLIADTGEVTR